MRKETAYGIIAVRKSQSQWETLLVKHQKGHWSFPKGHAESGETPQETAAREIFEETGAQVIRFLNLPELEEHYFFEQGGEKIDKTVIYFLAEVERDGSQFQKEEIADCKWVSFEEAKKLITFPESKKVLKDAYLKLQMSGKL